MENRAASRLVLAEFSEQVVMEAARALRAELDAEVSCAIVFFSSDYIPHLPDFLELVRVYGKAPLLLGSSAAGLIGRQSEAEDRSGFSLLLLSLPRTRLRLVEFSQAEAEESTGPGFWHMQTGIGAEDVDAWIVLTNPLRLNTDRWLGGWNLAYPGVPALGGLASGTEEEIVLVPRRRGDRRRRPRAGLERRREGPHHRQPGLPAHR